MTFMQALLDQTGAVNFTPGNLLMIIIGIIMIYLAITKHYEPLLLIGIGFSCIVANVPGPPDVPGGPAISALLYAVKEGGLFHFAYMGVEKLIIPPLIFLGVGAMTDFSFLLANPKLMLLGAAAQMGIFFTYLCALALGFTPQEASSIGIIGGADGPTSIFLTAKLAPHLIGPIAIAAYSYMALIPIIQPPIMKLLTSRKERLIRMPDLRDVSRRELVIFPVVGLVLCTFLAPASIPLLGPFFFGNIMKESGVVDRLANTARNAIIDTATIILGLTVGASTSALSTRHAHA